MEPTRDVHVAPLKNLVFFFRSQLFVETGFATLAEEHGEAPSTSLVCVYAGSQPSYPALLPLCSAEKQRQGRYFGDRNSPNFCGNIIHRIADTRGGASTIQVYTEGYLLRCMVRLLQC